MQFDYVSWEAFATLLAGLAAVVAAYLIGRQQMKILARQADTEHSKLRIDLFDRRMKIVDLHSKLASLNYDNLTRLPFVREFMDNRGAVIFLFDGEVAKLLDEAYEIGIDLDAPVAGELSVLRQKAGRNRTAFLEAVGRYMQLDQNRP